MDLPSKEFTGTLKKSAVINLRRILRDNPYATYTQWRNSGRKDKPKFITFKNARKNPEIIKDFFGNRFVVLSAVLTDEKLSLPMGIPEKLYLDKINKGTKKYILTNDLAQILQDNRLYPYKISKLFPFGDQTIRALCKEMGFSAYADRNTWLAQHIEEILNLTAKDFCLKYGDMNIKKNVIFDIKANTKLVISALKNNPTLVEKLSNNWKKPNKQSRKKLDILLGANKSKKLRRVFSILKEAKIL